MDVRKIACSCSSALEASMLGSVGVDAILIVHRLNQDSKELT